MDAREIEKCMDEFGTDIYRFCLKLCTDRPDAEDLYQQTFLKALETDLALDWKQNPKALFFSIVHSLWKSDKRKQARRSLIAPCSRLDDEIQSVLYRTIVLDAIVQTLPEKIRVPLILFYLSDCSIAQIAAIIKKPPGTVKSRLFKGRKLIQKRMEEAGYER